MTSPIITEAVRALVDRKDLSRIEAAAAMEAIMSGAASDAQIAAFLTALRMKGETVEELIGFAQVMRQKAVTVRAHGSDLVGATGTDREMLIDTAGTGGDASGTFNVSTATAFVVAGAGLRVAKHGNRSVSSLCGSADVVETLLKVRTELPPSPRSLVPRVDADMDTICLKCLQKEPANRYGSAAALADDLERWRRREPIAARPVGWVESGWPRPPGAHPGDRSPRVRFHSGGSA